MIENKKVSNNLAIPGAIVIAGILVAGSIVLSNGVGLLPSSTGQGAGAVATGQEGGGDGSTQANRPRPIDENDHIFGNPDAKIVIIEYSDFECPFCKGFHRTLHTLVEEFDGDLAWVYRQFPIPSLHEQATIEAIASECVAKLGGNDAFWFFADSIFEQTTSNDGFDLSTMPQLASQAGVDRVSFQTCLDEEQTADLVQADRDDAIASGAKGTPHSLIFFNNQIVEVSGAQPIENMRAAINQILE